MGAAKIPEQLAERHDAGLRTMLEDQIRDPIIERLKAMPVNRSIKPEETNRRRAISEGALKNAEAVSKRLINERRLKMILVKIAKLMSKKAAIRTPPEREQLGHLKSYADRVRSRLPAIVLKKKKLKKQNLKTPKRRLFAKRR